MAFCDTPTINTGFARVARNLLTRWTGDNTVHCVGINFDGLGYEKVPFQLFPGGRHDWNSFARLDALLRRLDEGDYTHLWMLADPDSLSVHGFPKALRSLAKRKKIKVMLYYPVDASLETEWLAILDAVDVAVAYTEYGRQQSRLALKRSLYPIEVIPHGVEACFAPLDVDRRLAARRIEIGQGAAAKTFLQPDDFLIVNVNKNEWRKDLLRTLEIFQVLREDHGVPAKLLFRTADTSTMGGIVLPLAAKQLGLTRGVEWDAIGPVEDNELVALYNAADLYLTTSLGEGWGLGVTEAMACHCPVAMPRHTSLAEIGEHQSVVWLPQEAGRVCGADTRLRSRVDLVLAAQAIADQYRSGRLGKGMRRSPLPGDLWTWDQVADKMLGLLLAP